ncbi:alpha-beta hydrolase superfamily lysophospholipase [Actinophytocola oryzae]|uniref:Alpha-beta hydrolase superfamily lysophospholipase n=1 Tax=Actinophytocola oryzae TaxID=502181 RepID=A0A4R7VFI9_9PSEU|nr:alpha-beta hydrolase superfamily lysophospholipase [Actinophytocola oryzae]
MHGLGSTFDQNWRRPGWVDVLVSEGVIPRPVRLPGHGGAPVDGSAADAVLAAAGDEPTAAAGFSAGAVAVLAAAAREPHRFTRLAVLGVGDRVLDPAPGRATALAAALRGPAEPEDIGHRTFWRMIAGNGNDRHEVASYLESAPRGVPEDGLRQITCPVLVVIGDRDTAMPAQGLVDALPDARLVVLRGVDHFATVSALAAMDAVTRFLASR